MGKSSWESGGVNIGMNLESQLCFALHAANADVQEAYREPLARLRLTYPQYLTMLVLWEGNAVAQSAVATRLRQSPRTTSNNLRRLEQRGLVVRRPGDANEVSWQITEKGIALREHAAQMQSCMETSIALDADEVETLRRLTLKVLGSSWRMDLPPQQD